MMTLIDLLGTDLLVGLLFILCIVIVLVWILIQSKKL